MQMSRITPSVVIGVMFMLSVLSATIARAADAAEKFPNRPVRLVVPFPPGGTNDILARVVARRMSDDWRQAVVIENQPGANTGIAAQAVVHAANDGYTLLSVNDVTMVMNVATGADIHYDPRKDFAPISLLAKNTPLLLVRAADGAKDMQDLIARGKASRQKLNYGAGITVAQLAGQMFAKAAGFEAVLIPYKGSSDVIQGLLSGSVDFIIDGVASSLPLIDSGQFRALAKLNSNHLRPLPDLQTWSAASKLPQLGDLSIWIGLVAPAGTDPAIVAKINAEVQQVYSDPAVVQKLDTFGIQAVSSSPAEFDAFFRQEIERWSKVYKESGISLN
jgi:tripartite-type tricarboxylate transporter receptor subunit TctC